MFSINFIRHEFVPAQVRRNLLVAGQGWLFLNALVMVGLVVVIVLTHGQSWKLQAAIKARGASATTAHESTKEMDILGERAAQDLGRLQTFIALKQQQFPVGGKLAALARTLPPRTWLTQLSGNRDDQTLTIQAAYLLDPDSPYDLPAKAWLAALKEEPGFREGLARLEVGQSSRKRVEEAELFSFELIAEWKAGAGHAARSDSAGRQRR